MAGHVRPRHRKDGSTRCWEVRYRDPGDPTGRRRIEKSGFPSKRAANEWLTQQSAAVLRGDHADPRKADMAFTDVVAAWRSTWLDLAPKTRDRYENVVKVHLLPEFSEVKVGAITHTAVQGYVARLSAGGMSPGTVQKVHTVPVGDLHGRRGGGHRPRQPLP